MSEIDRDDLDRRIAVIRANIAALIIQAASAKSAAAEDVLASRMSEQQVMLDALLKKREAFGAC